MIRSCIHAWGVIVDSKNRVIVNVFTQDGDWLLSIVGTGNNPFIGP